MRGAEGEHVTHDATQDVTHDVTYDADLVLEGGGVKGIALVGAVTVLEERGYRFHRVAGTSAGAIVGALIAAGVPARDLRRVVQQLDYRRFQDGGWLTRLGAPGRWLTLLVHHGVHPGDHLRDWLRAALGEHGVRTFGDLRLLDPGCDAPPPERHRLVVMASDLTHGRLRRLPWEYERYGLDPDEVEVVDAVRASMAIPFFFRPVKLHDRVAGERAWLVDGGMLSSFPVDVFDRRDGQRPRWPTLGIKLSARADAAQGVRHRITGLWSMGRAMLGTMTGFYDRIHLDRADVRARTIFVDTMKVRSTDFDLDRPTQQRLYDNGRRAAERFLDGADGHPGWDFDAYVDRFRR
jgi:NTE family protein